MYDYDFDSRGKHMSHVWNRADGTGAMIVAKGSLEGILEHCMIDSQFRGRAMNANAELAARGMLCSPSLVAHVHRYPNSLGRGLTTSASWNCTGYLDFTILSDPAFLPPSRSASALVSCSSSSPEITR